MKYCFILLCLGISACGGKVDNDFIPLVRSFGMEMNVSTDGLIVQYTNNMIAGAFAICNEGSNTINVPRYGWAKLDEMEKEQTLYHEMGHCLLHRGHIDEMVTAPDGELIEASIMYPKMFAGKVIYTKYRAQYKQALKENRKVF